MTDFKVTSKHQIERGGRLYGPNQIIPGFDPKNETDQALIDHGQVAAVDRPAAKKSNSKASATKPTENKTEQVAEGDGAGTDKEEQA